MEFCSCRVRDWLYEVDFFRFRCPVCRRLVEEVDLHKFMDQPQPTVHVITSLGPSSTYGFIVDAPRFDHPEPPQPDPMQAYIDEMNRKINEKIFGVMKDGVRNPPDGTTFWSVT